MKTSLETGTSERVSASYDVVLKLPEIKEVAENEDAIVAETKGAALAAGTTYDQEVKLPIVAVERDAIDLPPLAR